MPEESPYSELQKQIEELETRETAIEAFALLQRENESLFRAIIENIPVMIDAFDEQGKGVLWNKECEKVLGWSKEDILARPDPLSMLYPDQNLRDRILRDKIRADGTFDQYPVTTKHGDQRTQLWTNFRLPNGAIISVGQDITERIIAEESLRKSEEHFRDLVENSPTGISIVQDEKIVYRNPEQVRVFGPLDESNLPSMFGKIHPEDKDLLTEICNKAMDGHPPAAGLVLRFIHLLGETTGEQAMKWFHCRASLIEYQGKKAVLINMMDVSKAREVQRLLGMKDRMASLGHMAAGIAHEIRNPLSGINIYLDAGKNILDKGEDIDKIREVFDKIQYASSKIESVIKRVMDFSKPMEPKLVPIDIHKPIEDALGLSSVTMSKTGIIIETDLSRGLPLCIADPQLIEHVILNLITNASEAMKDMERGKKIFIGTSRKGDKLLVSVDDTGPGVHPNLVQKIFDPFFTTKSSSTGIGLSLCQRIIHDHGGTLGISTSPLGGAKFTFSIPIRKGGKEQR
jgi:PAS domain S-box-containing protein